MADPLRTPDDPPQGIAKPRACAKCAKLKMKCHWPVAGSSRAQSACTRCARMKLDCRVPHPQPRKKRVTYTRVAQLEEKLDGLVSLLSTQQPTSQSLPPTPQSAAGVRHPPGEQQQQQQQTPSGSPTAPSPDWASFESLLPSPLTLDHANTHLQAYRTHYMPRFPFVILPPDATAQSLLATAPCLLFTILSIAAPVAGPSQSRFKIWFRAYVAEHVVVRQEKTLGLLQAILVHLAWGHAHHFLDLQVTSLLQLAGGLISDLRLDRGGRGAEDDVTPRSCLADAWTKLYKGAALKRPVHTVDEKRAVLGYHHHTSLLSTLFRCGPLLLDSNYLSECCDVVEAGRERDSDTDVVVIARLQIAAQQAAAILPLDWSDKAPDPVTGTAVLMGLKGFDREMQSILQSQPSSVQQRPHVKVIYHVLRARLFEPALSLHPPASAGSQTLHRGEALSRCLEQNAKYYAAHQLISTADVGLAPFTFGALAAFSVVTSSRLLLLGAAPDWDPPTARRRLDFAATLLQLSEQMETADALAREQGRTRRLLQDGTAVTAKYAQRLRWIRQWYLWKTEGEGNEYPPDTVGDARQQPPFDPGAMNLGMPEDDIFWDGFLVSLDPSVLSGTEQSTALQPPCPRGTL